MTRLCEHCGVNVEVDASDKFVRHEPASNEDARKRADGACLGSGRRRYWEELPPTCPTCGGPIPNTTEVDAHDHQEECEGCTDFCWYGIGGEHCSRELPEGLQANRMQFSVTLEPALFRRLLTIPFDEVAIVMVDGDAVLVDQVEYDGMFGSNDFCRGGGSRVFFRVEVTANDRTAINRAITIAKRVQRRLVAFLKGRI